MDRPEVTVVMPFGGEPDEADEAIAALRALTTRPGDELILVDNGPVGLGPAPHGLDPAQHGLDPSENVRVVKAGRERSPAYARNAGARHAHTEWILFLDADCVPAADLLDAYFAEPIDEHVGALAGEVQASTGTTVAARYAGARNFLRQDAHLAHAYRPRAVAANLLVRREAFEQLGGFYEGLRAAEDTDFSWRLQAAGWLLEGRAGARVEHRYRAGLRDLLRQWRGYAAGRAWLARRYDGFEPQPAVVRAAGRAVTRVTRAGVGRDRAERGAPEFDGGPLDRARFAALDALLGVEELAGFVLSNRPQRPERRAEGPVQAVLVADRFPARDDPLVDFARTLGDVRVEAAARPAAPDHAAVLELRIDYREDDGAAARAVSLLRLLVRHPVRAVGELLVDRGQGPTLLALAPAALRLERDRHARVQPLGAQAADSARRLAALAGTQLGPPPSP